MESEERLWQLDFLIERVVDLQRRLVAVNEEQRKAFDVAIAASTADSPLDQSQRAEGRRLHQLEAALLLELKLSAESFYYFASRLIGILQGFSQLKNLDVPSIRNVRNHLIEHSEKASSGVTNRNWSYGGDAGPAFKNHRLSNPLHVPLDAGLFVNAAQLRDVLVAQLSRTSKVWALVT